jgi:hypothetical protein
VANIPVLQSSVRMVVGVSSNCHRFPGLLLPSDHTASTDLVILADLFRSLGRDPGNDWLLQNIKYIFPAATRKAFDSASSSS